MARRRLPWGSVLLLGPGAACTPDPQLPEVHTEGRFVRYASADADEPCAGTVDAIDTFVAQLLDTFQRPAPDSAFVTYYWLPDGSSLAPCGSHQDPSTPNCAHLRDDGSVVIYSQDPLNRHELVHAVHFVASGPGPRFVNEGLAQLYGDQLVDPGPWPAGLTIDEAIAAAPFDYLASWHLVHAIVRRHGVESLLLYSERASPLDPTDVAGLRSAFIEVLGEDIEATLEPTASSLPCTIPSCNLVPTIAESPWELLAPEGCDDVTAVGGRRSNEPIVTTQAVFDLPITGRYPLELHDFESEDGLALRRCDDTCDGASDEIRVLAGRTTPLALEAGRWQVSLSNRCGTPPGRVTLGPPDP